MQKLKPEGLGLIKKKYELKTNTDVAKHIGVNFTTLWRALTASAGGAFVAKTLQACPGFSYFDLFFDPQLASLQVKKKKKGGVT